MRILRLRAYYKPEVTSADHMSDDMDKVYIDHGIVNLNYAPVPTRGITDATRREYKKRRYEEMGNGYIIVKRFYMFRERKNALQRVFRYCCCSIVEYIYGVKTKEVDIVHSSSTPPTQGLLSGLVAKRLSSKYGRKVPFVYNLQDIFPDSLINARMIKKGGLIWRIGRLIEDYTYRLADKIIVINNTFKQHLLEMGVSPEKIVIVNNWIDLESIKPISKSENRLYDEYSIDRDKYTIVYAGNIGETQGAEIILDVAKTLSSYLDVQFVVFGGGSRFEDFKRGANELRNVRVFSLLTQERVAEVYSLGDVALITCRPGTGSAGMPSKMWSIMACNTPIIASFDLNSELASVIIDAQAGEIVLPGDVAALKEKILYAYTRKKWKETIQSRLYVINNASKDICTQKYLDVLINAVKGEKTS